MAAFLTTLYTIGSILVGIYALRTAAHAVIWWRLRRSGEIPDELPRLPDVRMPIGDADGVPFITVQLPVFNERMVAARAIDAACRMRWPRERFEVQVVDDSTDETRGIVDRTAAAWRGRGVAVHVVRRATREGFKGGALARATERARGEFLAIFDADFLPPADFLLRTVPVLTGDDDVAVVQARWAHLNADDGPLLRAQALALDGYFVVEQTARASTGLALNFNGTGGLWRKQAIRDAGGWRGDTLTEDVDLSYRAQLAGWRVVYRPDLEAPGELPPTIGAFKRQQARWARGTIQCARRLIGEVWRSGWPLSKRLHAVASLTNHLVQPVMVTLVAAAPLMAIWQPQLHPLLLVVTVLSLGQPGVIIGAQRWLHPLGWRRRAVWFPYLSVLAAGMTVNGAVAVWRGLFDGPGRFERTPKRGDGSDAVCCLPAGRQIIAEAAMGAWTLAGLVLAVNAGAWGSIPLLVMFTCGYGLVAVRSWAEGRTALAQRQYETSRAHIEAMESAASADGP